MVLSNSKVKGVEELFTVPYERAKPDDNMEGA